MDYRTLAIRPVRQTLSFLVVDRVLEGWSRSEMRQPEDTP